MRRISLCLLVLAACGESAKTYDSFGALIKAQEEAGFVRLGTFGDSWPATIKDEKTARDEISFTRSDGTPHTYPGYTGYTLKVIRLESADGEETLIVFRSKEKN